MNPKKPPLPCRPLCLPPRFCSQPGWRQFRRWFRRRFRQPRYRVGTCTGELDGFKCILRPNATLPASRSCNCNVLTQFPAGTNQRHAYQGKAYGNPEQGIHGIACATKCAGLPMCNYWISHTSKGCILKYEGLVDKKVLNDAYEAHGFCEPKEAINSAIFTAGGDIQAVTGWVQSDFADFRGKAVKLERCYSMAQAWNPAGWMAQAGIHPSEFQAGCAGRGPTVTIIKTDKGHIFGGAADKSWASAGGWVASDSAFLFCAKCAGAAPGAAPSQLKLNGKYNQQALCHGTDFGPVFGGSSDLVIGNTPTASNTNLGYTYTCPAGEFGSTACNNYLAGSLGFTVADYEVFVIKAAERFSTCRWTGEIKGP